MLKAIPGLFVQNYCILAETVIVSTESGVLHRRALLSYKPARLSREAIPARQATQDGHGSSLCRRRACMATPLSGISWLKGSSKTSAPPGKLCTDSHKIQVLLNNARQVSPPILHTVSRVWATDFQSWLYRGNKAGEKTKSTQICNQNGNGRCSRACAVRVIRAVVLKNVTNLDFESLDFKQGF